MAYARNSVAAMARSIGRNDAGWRHWFLSGLDQINQYSGCGCEFAKADPIDDVPALWQDLETDRSALWDRIRELSGCDLAAGQTVSDGEA